MSGRTGSHGAKPGWPSGPINAHRSNSIMFARAARKNSVDGAYPLGYACSVINIRQTDAYEKWFRKLRDRDAKMRILIRIKRLSADNPGDVRSVGGGISELRVDHGPGYRIYFCRVGEATVMLLAGGDKSTQRQDIESARHLARTLGEGGS